MEPQTQQRLRERLKRQRDARLRNRSKQQSYRSYGVTLEVFDRVQEEVRGLYAAFPTLVPKQIEHFVLNGVSEFKSFPPELKDHVCTAIQTSEERTNNERVRDVIRAREVVDAAGGDRRVAMQQHKRLKEKYTQDFVNRHNQHNQHNRHNQHS